MATLTGQFTDTQGKRVVITITNANIPSDAILVLGKDPLHISMSQPDDKYPGVRTFEAEISVLTKNSLAYLYSDDPLATVVTITLSGRTIFRGYLMPSEWQQPMTPGEWNDVQIVAIDALAALKNVWFSERTLIRGTADEYGTPSLISMLQQYCGADITVSYQTGMDGRNPFNLSGILDGYFSSEAFVGTDLEDADAHTTIGEMLEEYARAMGVTFVMIANTLYVYRNDMEPVNESSLTLADTTVDFEMVPPVHIVKGEWDPIPQVEKPKATAKFYNVFTYDTGERINVPVSYNNDWEAYQWPDTFKAWSGTKPSLFGTGSKEPNASEMFPGLGARQKPEACHIYVPYQGSFLMGMPSLTYDVHNNHERGKDVETNRMALLPDDCVVNSLRENAASGSVMLCINNTSIKASEINNVYGIDDHVSYNEKLALQEQSKWNKARLTFNIGFYEEDLIRARGRIQMQVVQFWQYRPAFVKNIQLEQAEYDSVKDSVVANSSPVFDDMDFNSRLCTRGYSKQSVGAIGFKNMTYITETDHALTWIAGQYAKAHPQWTLVVEDGYLSGTLANVTRHLSFQGKVHTIQAFDWNLRSNTTEITILEDYKQ